MATYADISQPWLSGDSRIDALLFQWPHWQYETPSDSAIYYTFSTTEGNQSDGFFQPTDISSFSAAQEAAARQALADAAAVTGIQFVEVANGTLADIHFANGDLFQNAAGQMSGSSGGQGGAGRTLLSYDANAYIYLDSNEYAHLFTNPAPGTEGYQILLHELGHALGLKHPHEGEIRLAAAEDNTGNTVMSYNWSGAPKSDFQAYDVDALQWWYGTDGLGGVSYGGTQTMTLNGTTGADRLTGGGGSDTMNGSAGNDTLIGGGGNDVIDGGAGADSMDGGLGGDMYYASTGDVLTDAGGFDVVFSDISWTLAAGFEELELLAANLVGTGNGADNVLWGGFGNSTLIGGAGDDDLYSRGSGTLQGGPGNDLMVSTLAGDNRFVFAEAPGAANSDLIFHFGNGADKIVLDPAAHPNLGASGQFTAGDARFFAGPGASSGQDASDRVVYNTSTGELWYDADGSGAGPAQLIVRMEPIPALAATDIVVVGAATPGATITGTGGNDTLTGTSGNDTLNGLGGNDALVGSAGADFYDGGTGRDTLDLRATAVGVAVSFADGTISGGFSGTFINIERVLGSDVADSLIGAAGAQTLSARGGDDTLAGGTGNDTLWGGTGADSFVFRETGTANADSFADFASGEDKVVLDASVMTALGPSGNFTAGDARFVANSTGTAQDASDRVIFNTTTKQLLYDADGNGSGAAVLIATLQSGATLVATDIVVEGGSNGQVIDGTSGNDSLVGGPGDDTISGLGGDDTLRGQGGNDSLNGGDGHNLLDGGDGDDTLVGEGSGSYHGGAGHDLLIGGTGNEEFFPGEGNDRVETGEGSNVVTMGFAGLEDSAEYGNDTLIGGTSDDVLNMFLRSDVVVDMRAGGLTGGSLSGGGNVSFSDFDAFGFFGDHSVHFTADDRGARVFANGNADDTLIGGAGNDRLFGGGGTNLFIGGDGADTMSSSTGEGVSTFVFNTAPTAGSADTIFSFVSGVYSLHFDASVFTALGAAGNFAPNDERFHAAEGATQGHDATDRLIYNSLTGDLWYDADGNGAGASVFVATLPRDSGNGDEWTVVASDIWLDGNSGQVITGTSGNDTLDGTAGDDTIDGLGGNDVIHGNLGADSLRGGDGNDTLFAGEGTFNQRDFAVDTLDGGLGDDVYHVFGDDGDVILADPGGIDHVFAWNSNWTLGPGLENLTLADDAGVSSNGTGNELDNRIVSATEGGTLLGLGGNDTLISQLSENTLVMRGGDGNDTLLGNGADGGGDQLFGDAGDDLLATGGGNSTVTGGAGEDVFYFNARLDPFENADPPSQRDLITDFASATDTIRLDGAVMPALGASGRFSAADGRFAANSTGTAQDSTDRVIYNTSNGDLWYDADGSGAEARLLIGTWQGAPALAATDIEVVNGTSSGEVINGTSGNDTLTGTAGDDTINGFDGNDLFLAGSTGGNDVINGGAGRDSIEFKERATSAIVVDFVSGTITGGAPGTISFTSIERVLTGNFNDSLTGNAAGQTLTGQGGSDTIWGAGGVDTLWGGSGADVFVFREMGASNADRISDFASGSDKLHLDDAVFTAIGAMGSFAAGDARFKANSSGTATDTNDRVVFNTSTGGLYYDADGSGSGGSQLIATVQTGATVAAGDIVVI